MRSRAWHDGEFHGARLSLGEPGQGLPADVGGTELRLRAAETLDAALDTLGW